MTSSAPGPLVLIVDDNERNLKLASDVLKAAGFRTLAAVDGAGALALAKEEIPDLVLLDLRLPDLDGADVARALARGRVTFPSSR
jgi:CheY-like chemotaxis protein